MIHRRAYLLGLVLLTACPRGEQQDRSSSGDRGAASPPDGGEAAKGITIVRSHKTMGTQVTITLFTKDQEGAEPAIRAAFSELDRIDLLMTVWRPNSDVSRINAAAGNKTGVVVSEETISVLQTAAKFSQMSGGKFDVTFGALSGLWKFDHDQDNELPDMREVRKRLPLIDYRRIHIDEKRHSVRLEKAGMRIHLGGIGKGYGVDRAVALLRDRGFRDFMIQAGGDMYVSGRKGDRNWRVGIRDPRSKRSDYFAFAEVTDATFSTSGDYERFFIKEKKRYHHIIDPDTGEPARKCRSVTIMAEDAITADALSTSVFLLGPEQGSEMVDRIEGAGAVIVDSDNNVHVTDRLKGRIKVIRQPTP